MHLMAGGERDKSSAETSVTTYSGPVYGQAYAQSASVTPASTIIGNDKMKGEPETPLGTTILRNMAEAKKVGMNEGERRVSESTGSFAGEDEGPVNDTRLADRKIFVGGLCWETTERDLHAYFSQFGRIQSCQIKYDGASQQPRGFGFVVFDDAESVRRVLAVRDQHHVCGKRVDPKPAKPSKDVSRKVFVGGLSPEAPYEQIFDYFSQFGKVESLDLPFDSTKCSRKNYVFVAYATKHEASAAAHSEKQFICGRTCDVRIALPRDEILKMKSRGIPQAAFKFAAPQSLSPNVACRSYSGPAAMMQLGSVPGPAAATAPKPVQPPYALAPPRFRPPYRSSPGGADCGFAGRLGAACNQIPPYAHLPQPPFQITLQSGPVGQLAHCQLCMLEQSPVPQVAYAPYYSAPPSMLAAQPYSQLVLPQQNELLCSQPYTAYPEGYVAQLEMNLQSNSLQNPTGVYPMGLAPPLGVVYAPLGTNYDQPAVSFTQSSSDSGIDLSEQQKAAAERMNERHVG